MLDREGFRPNVGIILLNAHNEVFWGKRLREHSWQFPQGGIKYGETPVQAMYRELHEETGLLPEHVKVIGRTRDWLRYEVPDKFIKREVRGHYRGQKQIWFLLRMVGRDCDICLRATDHPEFDAWRWNEYWVPLDCVIEFKRDVYQLALTELSRFMRRAVPRAEKPVGHHVPRYPRIASSMESPPDSTIMTVTSVTTVTSVSIETSVHTTIASDCGSGSGSEPELGAAPEHEDEANPLAKPPARYSARARAINNAVRLSWPPQPARLTEPRRCFEEIILKALALVVACVATGALLAGCSSAGKPTNKDDSAFVYLLDRQGNWVENKVDTLPPLPQDANLLPFAVSGNTPLQFAVDKNSLTVGTDGVVRLTVVVTSPSGARNVIYEGIRCDTYEWRQYAGLNADHDGWDTSVANNFTRIEDGALNAYQSALYQDYLCASKMPTGNAERILENIRYKRTAASLIR